MAEAATTTENLPAPVPEKVAIVSEHDGELRKKLTAAGYETASRNTPEQFGGFIRADTAKWVDLVARTNMKGN